MWPLEVHTTESKFMHEKNYYRKQIDQHKDNAKKLWDV